MNTFDWRNATPAQINLWKAVSAIWPFQPFVDTLTPLYFCGPIAGSEFLTYNANKIYLCLEGIISGSSYVFQAGGGYTALYDMGDAVKGILTNECGSLNVTSDGFNYILLPISVKNIWFSRIALTTYNNLCFNGYRLGRV